jgi:PAS domain S-box-containing protein
LFTSLAALIVGPAILLPLALYALRHRRVRGARWYAGLLGAIGLWSALYAWELLASTPALSVVAIKLKYLGVVALPVTWIGFILDFAARDPMTIRRITRRMTIFAVLTLLMAWSNDWHHLFWGALVVERAGNGLSIVIGRGPGFWINTAYTYCVIWAGVGILLNQAVQSPYLYRKRAGILVAATLIPWVGNVVFLSRLEGPGNVDPTPFLFTCTAVLAAVAVFRYRVLDPIPTFRDARIEVIGDGLIILDASHRIADLNKAAEQQIGWTRAAAAGVAIERVLIGWPPLNGGDLRRDVAVSTATGERIFDVRVTPVRAYRDRLTGYVVLLSDVTERRRAETALRDSEERYRDLVENAQDLIYTRGLDGRVQSVNRAGLQLTGYTREEFIGRHVLDFVAPELRAQSELVFQDSQHTPHAHDEVTILAKDGRRIVLELASWVERRNGEPVAVHAIGRDVTERRRLEDDLRQAQKMEAVGKLAGGVAHDFNNLLTAIIGFAALAEDEVADGPAREWLAQIRRSGEQAASVTRQLLAFGRRQILQPVQLDLNTVVEDVQKMLRRLIGEDVTLTTRLAPVLRPVRADLSQLQQVIVNLVVNARDAMPQGGHLTISTYNLTVESGTTPPHPSLAPGHYAAIVVRDTGEGIDPAILRNIFEPFFTTKDVGRGTGLGLATVYGIVKQSGGDVQVRSVRGRGSTFTVFLPAVAAAVSELPLPAATVPVEAIHDATLLVVEDDESVREFTEEALRSEGWTVLSAADPTDALAIAARESQRIDLLLTDVVLPGMSGGDLALRLCAIRPGLRVLFVSGYADEDVMGRGGLAPGAQLLEKPFTPAQLRDRVYQILQSTVES